MEEKVKDLIDYLENNSSDYKSKRKSNILSFFKKRPTGIPCGGVDILYDIPNVGRLYGKEVVDILKEG